MSEPNKSVEIPAELPVIPLRQFVVFPYMAIPLFLARDRTIQAVDDALAGERCVLLTAQVDPEIEDPEATGLYRHGTVAMVMRSMRLPDGRVKVLVQASRAEIEDFVDREGALWAAVRPLPADPEPAWSVEIEAVMRAVRSRVEELLALKNLPPEVLSVTST
jgi:ATP-dependent Lon protease